MKKAIVVGATSGMGYELAKILSENGYIVGLAGRREERLAQIQKELKTQTYVKKLDVTKTDDAVMLLEDLISQIGGLDLIIVSSGVIRPNDDLDLQKDRLTIDTNVVGLMTVANTAARYFKQQKHGHIVGISSIASLLHSGRANAYCASKAFTTSYLRGLRDILSESSHDIYVTEVVPGWVDTELTRKWDSLGMFWTASAEEAAKEIYLGISKKKRKIYISRKWRILGWYAQTVPDRFRLKK